MPDLEVLINHPYFGSVWLSNCYIEDGRVIGDAWDKTGIGDPHYPEWWRGEAFPMNFPVSCIRKRVEHV